MPDQVRRATLSLPQRKKQDLVRWLPPRRTSLLLVPTPNLSIPSWVRGISTPRAHIVQSVHRGPHDYLWRSKLGSHRSTRNPPPAPNRFRGGVCGKIRVQETVYALERWGPPRSVLSQLEG